MIEVAVIGLGVAVAFLAMQCRRYMVRESTHLEELARLKEQLKASTPTESCLRDVAQIWLQSDKSVMVRFYTIAGAVDLRRWLRRQATDAGLRGRVEAERNGRDTARQREYSTATHGKARNAWLQQSKT